MGSLGQRCLLFFIRTAAKGEAAVGTEWDEEMYDDGLTSWGGMRWREGRVICKGCHDGKGNLGGLCDMGRRFCARGKGRTNYTTTHALFGLI